MSSVVFYLSGDDTVAYLFTAFMPRTYYYIHTDDTDDTDDSVETDDIFGFLDG